MNVAGSLANSTGTIDLVNGANPAGTLAVTGSLLGNNAGVTVNTGTAATGAQIYFAGPTVNVSTITVGTANFGTSTFTLGLPAASSTVAQSLTPNATAFNNLTIKNTFAGTGVSIGSTVTVDGTLLMPTPANTTTVAMTSGNAIIATMTVNGGTFTSPATINANTALNIGTNGTVSVTGGSGLLNATGTSCSGHLTLSASADTFGGGTTFNAGANFAMGGGASAVKQITGNLSVDNTTTITGLAPVELDGTGTISGTSGLAKLTLAAVTFNGSGVTGTTLAVDLQVTTGTLATSALLNLGGKVLHLSGNFTNTTAAPGTISLGVPVAVAGSGFDFNGNAGVQLFTDNTLADEVLGAVTVNGAATKAQLDSAGTCPLFEALSVTVNAGATFDYNGKTIAFVANSNAAPLTVAGTASFKDTAATGTVQYTGRQAVPAGGSFVPVTGTSAASPTIVYTNLKVDNSLVAGVNTANFQLQGNVTTGILTVSKGTLDLTNAALPSLTTKPPASGKSSLAGGTLIVPVGQTLFLDCTNAAFERDGRPARPRHGWRSCRHVRGHGHERVLRADRDQPADRRPHQRGPARGLHDDHRPDLHVDARDSVGDHRHAQRQRRVAGDRLDSEHLRLPGPGRGPGEREPQLRHRVGRRRHALPLRRRRQQRDGRRAERRDERLRPRLLRRERRVPRHAALPRRLDVGRQRQRRVPNARRERRLARQAPVDDRRHLVAPARPAARFHGRREPWR